MPIFGNNILAGASGVSAVAGIDVGTYTGKSLEFNSASSQYLTRTPGSDGNRKTWTFSCWLKRHKLGTVQYIFNSHESGAAARPHGINFTAADKLNIFLDLGSTYRHLETTAVFKDTSAWYHIVMVFDSTEAALADRMVVYVNNELQATTVASSAGTVPALNTDYHVNDNVPHYIGTYAFNQSLHGDFSLAAVTLVDGQALKPEAFGHESPETGSWVIEEPPVAEVVASGGNTDAQISGTQFHNHVFTADGTLTVTQGGYVEYLVIGGGGSGASSHNAAGGGGGAGGYRTGFLQVPKGSYSITVGAGGATTATDATGNDGEASVFHTITASGGGGGGFGGQVGRPSQGLGNGSGGGGGYDSAGGAGGDYGNNGGAGGASGGGHSHSSGGGGGSSAVGAAGGSHSCGAGGAGTASSITGASVTRAGGGGGTGSGSAHACAGGSGGGGAGGASNTAGTAGTVNTGSGGGGGGGTAATAGGAGGSGIVIIRYFKPDSFSFGTNGFYFDFSDADSTTVTDNSANSNTYTATNYSSDVDASYIADTPIDNHATWSPLHKYGGSGCAAVEGLFKGNRLWEGPNGGGQNIGVSSLSVNASQDTFVEFKITADGAASAIGIIPIGEFVIFESSQPSLYGGATAQTYYSDDGKFYSNNDGGSSYGDTWTTNDVIGVRLNNGSLFFYKNGTIQNSGTAAKTGLTGDWLFACTGESGTDVTVRVNSGDWTNEPSGITSENQWSTGSLPDPSIGTTNDTRGTDYVNTVLYTGNGTAIGSGGNAITGVGFSPDFVTIRARNGSGQNWMNFDSVRGVTKRLYWDGDGAESTDSETLTAFGSDGFTVGNHGNVNTNTTNYVSYNWLAGTAVSGDTTGSGTLKTYTGQVNTDSKFAIIKYVGNGSDNHTIPHHIGVAPDFVISTRLTGTDGWYVFHSKLTSDPSSDYVRIDNTDATSDEDEIWTDAVPTSTVVNLGTNTGINANDVSYIMYAWANGDSFSSGYYEGNGNADGPRIYCPFRPQIVITRRYDSGDNWRLIDTARNPHNDASTAGLKMNATDTEADAGNRNIDFLSNGFKIRDTDADSNTSGGDYIWMAWAHTPFKFGNAF